jgi:TPR repeat protein
MAQTASTQPLPKPPKEESTREALQNATATGDDEAIVDHGKLHCLEPIIFIDGPIRFDSCEFMLSETDSYMLIEKAAGGNVCAMYMLGIRYEIGDRVPQDDQKAHEWYERAAAAGDIDSMSKLGWLYQVGRGVPQDYQRAKEWYERAAVAGDAGAMNNLGKLYRDGEGVRRDDQQAKEWYEKAAAGGNEWAEYDLCALEARERYEKATAAGDAHAMNNLGELYRDGEGVPKDYQKATQWYEKAAAAGCAKAMTNLGRMYEWGQGVPEDDNKAREWYEKASAGGDAEARRRLKSLEAGSRYQLALEAERKGDIEKAVEEYRKAITVDSRFAPAHYQLGRILEEKNEDQAALEEFAAACAIEPRNLHVCPAESHYDLALGAELQGDIDKAMAEYRRAIELAPNVAEVHYRLGSLLRGKGLLDAALLQLEAAGFLEPNNETYTEAAKGLQQQMSH